MRVRVCYKECIIGQEDFYSSIALLYLKLVLQRRCPWPILSKTLFLTTMINYRVNYCFRPYGLSKITISVH
ncbi:hypothetical protein Hanom_Chr03g00178611 [Helianthus anomalus]